MKIVIFGDSCALPRAYGQRVSSSTDVIEISYEETYPEKVRKALIQKKKDDVRVLNFSDRFYTSFHLLRKAGEIYLYQPEYVVIHLGLVDCWNRAGINFAPAQHMLGKNPWVSSDEFYNNMRNSVNFILEKIESVVAVVLLGIHKASEDKYQKHQGSKERTILYNELAQKVAGAERVHFVDLYNIFEPLGSDALCEDGIHPSAVGNETIAQEITKVIS